jgi:hypothetical protein
VFSISGEVEVVVGSELEVYFPARRAANLACSLSCFAFCPGSSTNVWVLSLFLGFHGLTNWAPNPDVVSWAARVFEGWGAIKMKVERELDIFISKLR